MGCACNIHRCPSPGIDSQVDHPAQLPLSEDITTLHKYLSKQEECIKSDMRNHGITDNNFAELAQCTFAEVVLYNRKVPTVTACKDAIESCPIFKKRTVVQVKSKVWTLIHVQKMRTDRSGE